MHKNQTSRIMHMSDQHPVIVRSCCIVASFFLTITILVATTFPTLTTLTFAKENTIEDRHQSSFMIGQLALRGSLSTTSTSNRNIHQATTEERQKRRRLASLESSPPSSSYLSSPNEELRIQEQKKEDPKEGEEERMVFQPFHDVYCADGLSNAGIYQDEHYLSHDIDLNGSSSDDHVMVFLGGGACTDRDECDKVLHSEPFKLSSTYYPKYIHGHTILSRNDTANPISSNSHRWLVPYCSQDLYLGNSTTRSSPDQDGSRTYASRQGSIHFETALQHWLAMVVQKKQVSSTRNETVPISINSLTVVGISAGGIGVMNHMDTILRASRSLNAKKLRIILDSTMMVESSDTAWVSNETTLSQNSVDPSKHPLCYQHHDSDGDDDEVDSSLFMGGAAGNRNQNRRVDGSGNPLWLPCCLSTTCMLQNGNSTLHKWLVEDEGGTLVRGDEHLLLIDSIYDPFAIVSEIQTGSSESSTSITTTASTAIDDQHKGGSKDKKKETPPLLNTLTNLLVDVSETAGERRQRFITAMIPNRKSDKISWITSSTMTHGFLLPSLDLETIRCSQGRYDTGRSFKCSYNGVGSTGRLGNTQLIATLWITTETWIVSSVTETLTLRDAVEAFIIGSDTGGGLIYDDCHGPYCVWASSNSTTGSLRTRAVSPAMKLFTIEGSNTKPPSYFLQAISLVFLLILMVSYVLRFNVCSYIERHRAASDEATKSRNIQNDATGERSAVVDEDLSGQNLVATVKDLNVTVMSEAGNTDRVIIDSVTFSVQENTMTGIVGLSGSGKTTLLSFLAGQSIFQKQLLTSLDCSNSFIPSSVAYLRQSDRVSMQNITPEVYLRETGRIYGTDEESVQDIIAFIRPFFVWSKSVAATTNADRTNVEPCKASQSPSERDDASTFSLTCIKDISGGQRRLVAIAAALLLRPKLLLLDEPLSGLDSASSVQLLQVLHQLRDQLSCAVVLTIHQPSDEVLSFLDQMLFMDRGKLVTSISGKHNLSLKGATDALHASLQECSKGRDYLSTKEGPSHRILSRRSTKSIAIALQEQFRALDSINEDSVGTSSTLQKGFPFSPKPKRDSLPAPKSITRPGATILVFFTIITNGMQPILRRIHLEHKSSILDVIKLPLCFTFLCAWVSFSAGSPFQLLYIALTFCVIPIIVFRHKINLSCIILEQHIHEMQDKRISIGSFHLASVSYMFSMPIFSLLISLPVCFWILGWHFNTLIPFFIYVGLYMINLLQLGRCICTFLDGNYQRGSKVFSFYVLFSFLCSGSFVTPNQIPASLRWVFYGSFIFWANSGIAMTQLASSNIADCSSFFECVASNGNVLVEMFGYTSITTAHIAMVILLLGSICLLLLEYLTLKWKYR